MEPAPARNREKVGKKRSTTETVKSTRSAPACGFPAAKELAAARGGKESRKPKKSKSLPHAKNSGGIFDGVYAVFISGGVSKKRLQVWQTKFTERGGSIIDSGMAPRAQCDLVHILGMDEAAVSKEVDLKQLKRHEGVRFVEYRWLEECLKDGQLLSSDLFNLLDRNAHEHESGGHGTQPGPSHHSPSETKLAKECSLSDNNESHASKVVRRDEGVSQGGPSMQDSKQLSSPVPIGMREEGEHVDNEAPDDEALDFNKHIAGPLRELSGIYSDVLGDEWRAITYRKVANKLDHLPYRISNADEMKDIFGVGKSMLEKISEILRSGTLQKLVSLKADQKVQVIQRFASVWGIGPKHARRLFDAGFRSLQDIKGDSSLSSMARIGLKYHDDIVLRIPRAEVAEAWLTIGGSYRRGQSTCGDIDLLITHPDGHSHKGLMTRLLKALREAQFLLEGKESDSQNVDTVMGICKLQQHSHHRRIDIKIYPMDVYAFALVYFTGNDVLNRRVRYFARQKGYKLSDQGLFIRGTNNMEKDVSIPCQTEQEVFEKLGIPCPEPRDRNW